MARNDGFGARLLRDRERRFLAGDSALGLLDPLFLGGIAHPLFAEAIHQFEVGGIELQRVQPGLSGVGESLLLRIDVAEMLVNNPLS